MSVLIEPGHVTEYPLNHARILYGNAITAATATGARANFPASASLTETTYERWSPAESGDSITLTFPDQNINAIALAAHSGLQPVIEVRQDGAFIPVTAYPYPLTDGGPALVSDFAAGDYQLYSFSPDNQAILFLLKPRRIDAIRITVTYSGTAPTLGVVRAGNVLEMTRPFYQGHNPAILAADNTLRPNVSESGEWLGASLIRQGRSVKMDWQNIASSWVREKWTPFSKTIKTSPFIIAWNAKKFSTDVFYCSSSDTPMPTHSGPRDLMSVSLSARGYSDGTEPEVLNLAASTFDDLFTFTRASVATITDIDGMLREVGADVPRLVEYDGAGGALGLLIEEQRTNLLKYSEKMDESVYRKVNVDVTPNAAISPNNATEGDKLVADNSDDFHWFYQNVTVVSGTEHTFSIFVKAGAVTEVSIRLQALSGSADIVYLYDLALGTGNGYIESFPNGWYRLSGSFTPDTTSGRFYIFISGAQAAYEGNGASLYIWGAQVEEGSFPTSYIPTAGAQVTRAVDDCVRTLGDEFNANEGALYVEFKVLAIPASTGSVVGFNDGTTSNRVLEIGLSTFGPLQFVTSGFSANVDFPYIVGQTYKAAISFNANTMNLALDGVSRSESGTLAATGINQMEIGILESSSDRQQNIIVKELQYFPFSKTEAELITLTGG